MGFILKTVDEIRGHFLHILGRTAGQHVPRRDIAENGDFVLRQGFQFVDRNVESRIEKIDPDFREHGRADPTRRVIMEKLYRYIRAVKLLEIRQPEGRKFRSAHEADDVIEHKIAVDAREGLALKFKPGFEIFGDLLQEGVRLVRHHHHRR